MGASVLAEQILSVHRQRRSPDDWIEPVLDQHFNPSRIAQDLESLFEEAIHGKQTQANSHSTSSRPYS